MNSEQMENKKKTYRAVIIGSGRIAASFDVPTSHHVLTHAHAITKHPQFTLLAMSDIDVRRGRKEAKKWGAHFFANSEAMLSEIQPDVVVIASPDETHTEMILLALHHAPKLIICEKPVGARKEELKQLKRVVRKERTPIVVNFSRRFDTETLHLRDELQKGKYGRIISANGIYTNGILHNGSHMIDLARFLFGEVREVKGSGMIPDHGQGAPSVVGHATFDGCPQFSLMSGDERAYAIFELEIITEKKRIRLENFGQEIAIQDVVPDPLFKGFKALSKRQMMKTKLVQALPELYTHAISVIEGRDLSRSSLSEALKTQAACFALLESASRKK